MPGSFVRHPDRPEWGLGQVQSAVGNRVTVNFEHAGKVLIDAGRVELRPAGPDPADGRNDVLDPADPRPRERR